MRHNPTQKAAFHLVGAVDEITRARRHLEEVPGTDHVTAELAEMSRQIEALTSALYTASQAEVPVSEVLPPQPKVRSAREIQRAHDILTAVLLDEVRLGASEEWRRDLNVSAGALCWVPLHDHNPAFANNLKAVEDEAARAGYRLVDSGRLESRVSGTGAELDVRIFGMPPALVGRPDPARQT